MNTAVRNIDKIRKCNHSPITIVLLAALYGKRMKTNGIHSLIMVNKKTLIEHQIDTILSIYPFSDIIVVTGFDGKNVKSLIKEKYNNTIRIVTNMAFEETNVVKSMTIALDAITDEAAIFIYGNLMFNFHAILITEKETPKIAIDANNLIKDDKIGAIINDGIITNLSYDIKPKIMPIFYLTKPELNFLNKIGEQPKYDTILGYELINKMIDCGIKFIAYENILAKGVEIDFNTEITQIQRKIC
jgi:choline kinase